MAIWRLVDGFDFTVFDCEELVGVIRRLKL